MRVMSREGWSTIIPVALLLAGCATKPTERPEPIIRTVEIRVPVAAHCVPATLSPAPAYPDTDAALKSAAGPDERYWLVVAGRLIRIARLGELETVVAGCAK